MILANAQGSPFHFFFGFYWKHCSLRPAKVFVVLPTIEYILVLKKVAKEKGAYMLQLKLLALDQLPKTLEVYLMTEVGVE